MIVNEIYDRVRAITYLPDEASNFEYITDAVETLCNKGNFDSQLGYLTIRPNVPGGDLITLPRDVEVPIAVNVDDTPTFTRDRFYEFTLNGPGSNTVSTDWCWVDKGTVPIFVPITDPTKVSIGGNIVADTAKTVTVTGRIDSRGTLQSYTLQLTAGLMGPTPRPFKTIEKVVKEATTKPVQLLDQNSNVLAVYDPDETFPEYRQIRISKPGATAYIQFRRSRFRVTTQEDFIPIRSKWGLLYMIKALKALADEKPDLAQKLEDQALKLTNEEQASHNRHIERASQVESATIRNLGYNNIDSVIVSDVFDDVSKIVGPISTPAVFDKITEAISNLSRRAQWDSQIGYVDIQTDQYEYVTLPRYVDYVIKLNVSSMPSDMKNKWYEFHLNGPGGLDWAPLEPHTCVDIGNVVTIRDVTYPQTLSLIPDVAGDSSVKVRVFGWYLGKRIMTPSPTDPTLMIDGFDVDGSTPIDRIDRITKGVSKGFIKLIGTDWNDSTNTNVLGYYQPDETEPNYRRLKLPKGCERVRIMYRRRESKITSLTDPIHLRSKSAIIAQVMATEELLKGKVKEAQDLEDKAHKYLMEDYLIMNQSTIKSLNFGANFTQSSEFIRC